MLNNLSTYDLDDSSFVSIRSHKNVHINPHRYDVRWPSTTGRGLDTLQAYVSSAQFVRAQLKIEQGIVVFQQSNQWWARQGMEDVVREQRCVRIAPGAYHECTD